MENTETLECYEQNVSDSDVPFIISDVRSLKENYNNKLSPVTSEIVVGSSSQDFNKNIGLTITCLQVPGLCIMIDNLTISLAESVISKVPFIQFKLQDKQLLATPSIDLKITYKEMAIFVQILNKVEDKVKDIVASGTKLNLVIQKMESSNLNGRGVGVFQNEFLSFVTNQYLDTVSQNMFCDKVKGRTFNQYSILTSGDLREPIDVVKKNYSSSTLPLASSEQIDLTAKDEIFQNFRNDIPVQSTVFFN